MLNVIRLKKFLRAEAAAVAVVFAMCLPMILGAAGMAVDLAQAYNVKNRLGHALDKAALAGGSADTEEHAVSIATSFYNANLPPTKLGTFFPLSVDTSNFPARIRVSAEASVPTTFMSALGVGSIDVSASSAVVHELAGVEAVLVLDVTGSMSSSQIPGQVVTKLNALKHAVSGDPTSQTAYNEKSFINIIFDRITDTDYIKIGIVPFASTVNVGPRGIGLDALGNVVGEPFIDRPANGTDDYRADSEDIIWVDPSLGTAANNNWWGCIVERAEPNDTNDAAPPPNWSMYRYPLICSGSYGGNRSEGECTKTCTNWGGCSGGIPYGGCRKYCYAGQDSTYTNGQCCTSGWTNTDPNKSCVKSPIQPLTNDEVTLKGSVNTLIAEGNTYGNVGMAWGWHVMTPTAPYNEGVPLEDTRWSKTVIFMSDGDNTINGTYSAYGKASPLTTAQQDDKFALICSRMKAQGITLYTISFGSGVSEDTKGMLRTCASGSDYYFDSTSTPVSDAFERIANQLSQLHIVE